MKKSNKKANRKGIIIFSILALFLILITFTTNFMGNTDVYDYTDVAKLFAGKYDAKIRTSHSYFYGFIHAPFVWLFENYIIFKVTSLISLFLLIYSVYLITGKNKKAFWLMALSPIVWYMAPWASPIQLSSLLFLWGYYFIKKYDEEKKQRIKNLFYSALLIGLAWVFWDAILFFAFLLGISFLYNKKLLHSFYFLIFLTIGVLPRLILDQFLFNFPFFTIIRHIMASLTLSIYSGFYNQTSLTGLTDIILVIIFIPLYTYLILKKSNFKQNKKSSIFIILSVALLLLNSQIRFVLLITPIIFIVIHKQITRKQFITQIAISLILILLVINPYLIQTNYGLNQEESVFGLELGVLALNINNLDFSPEFRSNLISADLKEIEKDYPDETFVVGNRDDSYQTLADLYWGDSVREFVSIQDYELNLIGDPIIFGKDFCSRANIKNRRSICASLDIRKSINDDTNYNSIKYAISEEETLNSEGFEFVEKYKTLSVFKKV